jgi:hypothetical protein
MPLNPGDIMFTANLTDTDGTYSESFSFIATVDISAGEVITFHDNSAAISFTVGASGLSALDRVTIAENSDTMTILNDPSNGSVTNSPSQWSISGSSSLIAGSNGDAIAAISNGSTATLANSMTNTGLTSANLNSAATNNNPSPIILDIQSSSILDDSVMYAGTTITGLDDLSNWVSTGGAQSHASPNISGTTYATQDASISCFLAGTLIGTPTGEIVVEQLQIGDVVRTADGGTAPVHWIGRQALTRHRHGLRMEPVCISAGALGEGLPHSDLTVTADHGMILDGLVINASALVNGSSVFFVPLNVLPEFTVYHIETEAHEVIIANGAPTETFVDAAGRAMFDNHVEYLALYGAERIVPEMDVPRVTSQRLLPDAIKVQLEIEDTDMLDLKFFELPMRA